MVMFAKGILDELRGGPLLNEMVACSRIDLLRQQTVLAKFGELALRSNDLDEILTEACHLVGESLGTNLAKVMELLDDGSSLHVRAGVGWKPGVVGVVTLRADAGTSEGYALKTGEPMVSPDIETETRFIYPQFLTDNGVRAVANVVILGGEGRRPFGILQIDSRTPRGFDVDTITFLRSYANLIAAAVDRLRVIDEVRSGQQRLRLALEASRMGSWELDLASGLATCTGRALEIFGYPEQSAAAGPNRLATWSYDSFLGHVLPEDRASVIGVFSRARATGADWHLECRIHRQGDGALRTIEIQGSAAFVHAKAAPTHLLGIMADITARKTNEQALREAHEALSLSHEQLSHSHDALEARVAERTHELVEANVRLQKAALEREQVEEALRQSNKMEAVGQLTGGLAHDFNNLLTAISGSLEMVGIRAAQGRTRELARYIDAALLSTNRAATLTHRLLAFSRRQTLDPKPTNVNQMVGGMIDLFRRTVGPSIEIQIKLPDDPWLPLCDPHQLESALLNLVINARDAMPDGGRLVIETANIVAPDRRARPRGPINLPPGDYVALCVTDTGSGMTPEVLGRAFDPFFTTKPLGQGTGLGLSMIYGFIEQSGGHVHLRSQPGQGTTVTIHLPRYAGAVEIAAKDGVAADMPGVGASAVVLVVEDEPHVRLIVVDVLRDHGYTVMEAADGHAGLRILESTSRIDLLVTDIGLPGGMNGRQLAEAAQQGHPSLKVLFITGYANGVAVNDLQDQSMQVVTKPFAMDQLVAKVRTILDA